MNDIMEPLDLSKAPPRSPYAMAAGLAMLPRTIDKMRAALPGGNTGDYHVDGMSERMLKIIGIDRAALQAQVARAATEDEVVHWVHAHADPTKIAEATHVMLNRSVRDIAPERLPEFAEKYPAYASAPSDKLCDIIAADDATSFAAGATRAGQSTTAAPIERP